MALTHLIDTSVLTRLNSPAVRVVVGPLAEAEQLARAGITDLEFGFAARNAREWDRYQHHLDAFAPIETTHRHVVRAKQVQRLLAAKSQRGRKIPDLLVAAAAEEHGLVVLHYDADFDRIASVTGQPAEWVVPSGTID